MNNTIDRVSTSSIRKVQLKKITSHHQAQPKSVISDEQSDKQATDSMDQSSSTPAISFLEKIWRRRVPYLSQMSIAECGLACLAMILTYHGHKTTISELRSRFGVGRDGLSAVAIVKAARQYNMR